MSPRPRGALHLYQEKQAVFLCQGRGRQVIAIMGAGKSVIALTAIVDLDAAGELAPGIILIVAPLAVAVSVWPSEPGQWEHTAHLRVVPVLGTPAQRKAALDTPGARIFVVNFDNLAWLTAELVRRTWSISLLIVDEASALKSPDAQRTRLCIALGERAGRRWALTGTPRAYQLLDTWGPATFISAGVAFPPFAKWRDAGFWPIDQYGRRWRPKPGVEALITARLSQFTTVVDEAALATRPPVVEVVHQVALPPEIEEVYRAADTGKTTETLTTLLAAGITPPHDMAVVGKLQQILSGAVYREDGSWQHLHDLRLDALEAIHAGHARPTLVYVAFRHEVERILARFPFACELTPELIDPWNRGEIEMLVAHPKSAGHGLNLQGGSDVATWFSLPWSAELYAQAIARLARQGQTSTVTVHILSTPGSVDVIALETVRQRLREQDRMVEALRA
jgi:SNF2-related domain